MKLVVQKIIMWAKICAKYQTVLKNGVYKKNPFYGQNFNEKKTCSLIYLFSVFFFIKNDHK